MHLNAAGWRRIDGNPSNEWNAMVWLVMGVILDLVRSLNEPERVSAHRPIWHRYAVRFDAGVTEQSARRTRILINRDDDGGDVRGGCEYRGLFDFHDLIRWRGIYGLAVAVAPLRHAEVNEMQLTFNSYLENELCTC